MHSSNSTSRYIARAQKHREGSARIPGNNSTVWDWLTHSAALLGYGITLSFIGGLFLLWFGRQKWTHGYECTSKLENWTLFHSVNLHLMIVWSLGVLWDFFGTRSYAGVRRLGAALTFGLVIWLIFLALREAFLKAADLETEYVDLGAAFAASFVVSLVFAFLLPEKKGRAPKFTSRARVLKTEEQMVPRKMDGAPQQGVTSFAPRKASFSTIARFLATALIVLAYPFGVIPMVRATNFILSVAIREVVFLCGKISIVAFCAQFLSGGARVRSLLCLLVHPMLWGAAEALGRCRSAKGVALKVQKFELNIEEGKEMITRLSTLSYGVKQTMAFYRRFMLLNMGSPNASLAGIVVVSIEEALSRCFLFQIDTTIRSFQGDSELTGIELKLQQLAWMCDINQSSIAELSAIFTSSFACVLLQRHATIFVIGYGAAARKGIVVVLVQLVVELVLEVLVVNTAMWAVAEHGISTTQYWKHAKLRVFGSHAFMSIACLALVLYAFARQPRLVESRAGTACDYHALQPFETLIGGAFETAATPSIESTDATSNGETTRAYLLKENVDIFAVLMAFGAGTTLALVVSAASLAIKHGYQRRCARPVPSKDATAGVKKQISRPFLTNHSELTFEEEIGQGYGGVVWKGKFRGSPVAVKTTRISGVASKTARDLVAKIIRIGPLIKHPNLACSFIYGCWSDDFCVALQFCGRGSLKNLLTDADGGLCWEQPYYVITRGIARCFQYLHNEHSCGEQPLRCDLKPDNIVIDGDFIPRVRELSETAVFDFDAAMPAMQYGYVDDSEFLAARLVQSPVYCAPEVLLSNPCGSTADIYSFGITLLQMGCRDYCYVTRQFRKLRLTSSAFGWRPKAKPRFVEDHPQLWTLIQECWLEDRELRPTFDEIVARIEELGKVIPTPDTVAVALAAEGAGAGMNNDNAIVAVGIEFEIPRGFEFEFETPEERARRANRRYQDLSLEEMYMRLLEAEDQIREMEAELEVAELEEPEPEPEVDIFDS